MIWKCRNKNITYGNKALIMGIVNITPDSFSDGGNYLHFEKAVDHALQLINEGADMLDLGAQSTRPGYQEITPEEEWKRLQPVLSLLRKKTDLPLSVDTYFPYVAQRALEAGADIINDVSGALDETMAELIVKYGAGWVIMHSGAGAVNEVRSFFQTARRTAVQYGVKKEQLCFDMGIGFGKSYEQNLELIANTGSYRIDGIPLLLGTSRKRVIGKASGQDKADRRVYGNIAADTAAILSGVDIIRLHDIKNEIQGIKTAEEIKKWIR